MAAWVKIKVDEEWGIEENARRYLRCRRTFVLPKSSDEVGLDILEDATRPLDDLHRCDYFEVGESVLRKRRKRVS